MGTAARLMSVFCACAAMSSAHADGVPQADVARSASADPESKAMAIDESERAFRVFSMCIVSRAKTSAGRMRLVQYLAAKPSDPNRSQLAMKIAEPDCVAEAWTRSHDVRQLSFSPMLLRGGLFRALYLDKRAAASIKANDVANGWSEDPAAPADTVLRKLGNCVVSLDSNGADGFVRADVGTVQRSESLHALAPALGNCLQEGSTLKLSKPVLDSILSEALYRRAQAMVPASASLERN